MGSAELGYFEGPSGGDGAVIDDERTGFCGFEELFDDLADVFGSTQAEADDGATLSDFFQRCGGGSFADREGIFARGSVPN